jgi:synaptosomal-associated protein 25
MVLSQVRQNQFSGLVCGIVKASLVAQVSAMIGNIRNMSNDMNGALVRQNQTLDRINLKAGSDITRVKMANERAAALMK